MRKPKNAIHVGLITKEAEPSTRAGLLALIGKMKEDKRVKSKPKK